MNYWKLQAGDTIYSANITPDLRLSVVEWRIWGVTDNPDQTRTLTISSIGNINSPLHTIKLNEFHERLRDPAEFQINGVPEVLLWFHWDERKLRHHLAVNVKNRLKTVRRELERLNKESYNLSSILTELLR